MGSSKQQRTRALVVRVLGVGLVVSLVALSDVAASAYAPSEVQPQQAQASDQDGPPPSAQPQPPPDQSSGGFSIPQIDSNSFTPTPPTPAPASAPAQGTQPKDGPWSDYGGGQQQQQQGGWNVVSEEPSQAAPASTAVQQQPKAPRQENDMADFLFRHSWLAFYLVGCAVAFVVGIICLFIRIFSGLTAYSYNLRKIGLRISWTYGSLKEISENDMGNNFLGFILKLVLSVIACACNSITSWIIVIVIPFIVLWRLAKSIGVPRDVRDARWRLRNLLMDFDGVFRNLKAIEGKVEYSQDRTELLNSLRDRNLISEDEFNRLMTAGGGAAPSGLSSLP
jgi:hypothetical protein